MTGEAYMDELIAAGASCLGFSEGDLDSQEVKKDKAEGEEAEEEEEEPAGKRNRKRAAGKSSEARIKWSSK